MSMKNISSTTVKTAIVIVTFNRVDLLKKLLSSIAEMSPPPAHVVIVDNASTDQTATAVTKWESATHHFETHVLRQQFNTGGAGGFYEGMKFAENLPVDWLWVMDDDVVPVTDALFKASKWMEIFSCFMGKRWDQNGKRIYWQPTLGEKTGIAPLNGKDPLDKQDFVLSNSGCFEGMFIKKNVVKLIGLPDPRFFITWDDATYGWLVSKKYQVAYVNEYFLSRTRAIAGLNAGTSTVTARNDLGRRYVIRNRAIQAKYFMKYGRYSPVAFAFGTVITICKEILRTLLIEKHVRGIAPMWTGFKEMLAISRDKNFSIPYLVDDANGLKQQGTK